MIHKYMMNDHYIVLDVNSGAVHLVDEIVYDILDYYTVNSLAEITLKLKEKYDNEVIIESYGEIKQLEEAGMLYSNEISQDIIEAVKNRNSVIKALCIHIAHDCNLKCKYCFAEEGEYKGKRELMSLEVGKKAIDFIMKNSGNRKNLEIDFFGGEPLMNFEVIKDIVKYGREQEKLFNKNIRFTITTNGILLDDQTQDYINEHMHNVVLSIDGRKEVNDKMRVRLGGQGSYDIIVQKFKELADSRNQKNYYVRGTFTRENLDFAEDVLHLASLGFKQISIEPVVADENEPYAIRSEDLESILNEYEKLACKMIEMKKQGNSFNFFHFMLDLTGGPCISKRLVGCGAGTEYVAVTPTGDFYPCHQFVGIKEFHMGDVFVGLNKLEIRKQFENLNVYSKEDCKDCFAKYYCSGGCAANSYNQMGDLKRPYDIGCSLQRKRVECAIMMKLYEN